MSKWIYLSPHFDDAVLSAGGLIWEQTQHGEDVEIWTICAGDPPRDKPLTDYGEMLQILWELGDDTPFKRSLEDAACCRVLGARPLRFTIPDNIYRYYPDGGDPVVVVPDDNTGPLLPREAYLVDPVAEFLRKNIQPGWQVVAPMAIGHHRDHVLTRLAAERLGIPLWHYVDFPYVIRQDGGDDAQIPGQAERYHLPISAKGLKAWQDGFACHRSQVIFVYPDEEAMRASIAEYHAAGSGATLWRF